MPSPKDDFVPTTKIEEFAAKVIAAQVKAKHEGEKLTLEGYASVNVVFAEASKQNIGSAQILTEITTGASKYKQFSMLS